MLQTKAKGMERKGQEDQALDTYLDILENYTPNNDFSYERAATLLEKKHRYNEALDICRKAITLIESQKIQGTSEQFKHKIKRIESKLTAEGAETKHISKEDFHFGVPGFRAHNRIHMIIGGLYYCFGLVFAIPDKYFRFIFLVALAFTLDYFWETIGKLARKKPLLKAFSVFLVALAICIYAGVEALPKAKTADLDMPASSESSEEGTGEGTATENVEDSTKEPPQIPESYLEAITKSANSHHFVDNTFVFLEEYTLYFDLLIEPSTSVETAQKVIEDMAYELGNLMESEGIKGPSKDSFGELYEYYGVVITIGSEFDDDLAKGMLTGQNGKIRWSEE